MSKLPSAVWVEDADASDEQKIAASDYSLLDHAYLVQVDTLTSQQKAKYCKERKS